MRLIGTHLQQWRGQLQLCGKNIQFGDQVICVSLSDAIAAWTVVMAHGAQLYFPKLSIVVIVTTWRQSDVSKGTQQQVAVCYSARSFRSLGSDMHVSAQFSDDGRSISGSFFFDADKCPHTIAAGQTVRLVGVQMQEWNGRMQLSGKNLPIIPIYSETFPIHV